MSEKEKVELNEAEKAEVERVAKEAADSVIEEHKKELETKDEDLKKREKALEEKANATPDPDAINLKSQIVTTDKVGTSYEPSPVVTKALTLGATPRMLDKFPVQFRKSISYDQVGQISPETRGALYLYGKLFRRAYELRGRGDTLFLDKEYSECRQAIFESAAELHEGRKREKLLSEGAAPGSLTIFNQLLPELVRLRDESTHLDLFRHITVDQPTGTLPFETAISTPGYVSEGAIKPQDDPTASHVDWTLYTLANVTIVSSYLLDDAVINWASYIVEENRRGFDQMEWNMLATGTGVGQPTGYASVVFTNTYACPGPLNYNDLMQIFHNLGAAWRPGAIWLMNDNAFADIDGLLDTTNRPIFDNQQSVLQRIKGFPVYINIYIAGTATSPDTTEIYFTNPNYWAIFEKGELDVDFNPRPTYSTGGTPGGLKSGWERDEQGWRFFKRHDMNVIQELATSEGTNVY